MAHWHGQLLKMAVWKNRRPRDAPPNPPRSSHAASILFEQFSQDPATPRKRAGGGGGGGNDSPKGVSGPAASPIRSMTVSTRPLSPRAALPPLASSLGGGGSPTALGKRSAADVGALAAAGADAGDGTGDADNGGRGIGAWRGAKAARQALGEEDQGQLVDAILRYHYYVGLLLSIHRTKLWERTSVDPANPHTSWKQYL
eukprot:356496-Chlamydomonas_euryale.AAC.8